MDGHLRRLDPEVVLDAVEERSALLARGRERGAVTSKHLVFCGNPAKIGSGRSGVSLTGNLGSRDVTRYATSAHATVSRAIAGIPIAIALIAGAPRAQAQEVAPNCDDCESFVARYQPFIVGVSGSDASSGFDTFYRIDAGQPNPPPPTQKTGLRSGSAVAGALDSPPVLAGYFFETVAEPNESCPVHAGLWTYGNTDLMRNRLPSKRGESTAERLSPLAQRWRAVMCNLTGEVALGWDARLGDQRGVFWTLPCAGGGIEFQLHLARELLAAPIENVGGHTITIEQMYDILPTGEILALVRQFRPPGSDAGSGDYNLYAAVLGLYGDLDGDHAVGASDLAVLLNEWGEALDGSAADINWDL